jgi:hypothetical protein
MRKGCRRANIVKYYAFVCANGKIRPVETKNKRRGVKENDEGVNLAKMYYKHF